jgi:ankyrin repeat protein
VVCIHELLCATDFNSNNALDWAADTGDVNTMEYLIRKRLDPTRTDGEGRTALHIAVKSGKLDAVRFLVKCGCDPYQLDTEKISPIAIAVDMQNRELVAIMKKEQRIKKLRERRKICCIPFNAPNIDPTSALSSSGSGGVAEVSGGREREARCAEDGGWRYAKFETGRTTWITLPC